MRVATFNFGYAFGSQKFTFEPNCGFNYMDVTLDPFAEQRSINRISNSAESRRFDLAVSEQSFDSLDLVLGAAFSVRSDPALRRHRSVLVDRGSQGKPRRGANDHSRLQRARRHSRLRRVRSPYGPA